MSEMLDIDADGLGVELCTVYPAIVQTDPDSLRRLYVDGGLTAEQVAAQLGCTSRTVLRQLRGFGIPARRRGPLPRRAMDTGAVTWTASVAYAVGLMATDGNLARDRRHMSFVSRDRDLVETLRGCLHLIPPARAICTSGGGTLYRVQWGSRMLYDWFVAVGLMPAKSRRLGVLLVPEEYFADFFRGCIDGDGSVLVYTDRQHARRKAAYVYERLYVSLVSARLPFVEWIQKMILRLIGVAGSIHRGAKPGHRPIWTLRYAKAGSIRILRWMYHSPDAPCLPRKRVRAEKFLSPLGSVSRQPVGRPRAGWLYNVEAPPPWV
jgi:hypothetical protein